MFVNKLHGPESGIGWPTLWISGWCPMIWVKHIIMGPMPDI